jgi:uncharacterized protein (PEP-CTERM system associated)
MPCEGANWHRRIGSGLLAVFTCTTASAQTHSIQPSISMWAEATTNATPTAATRGKKDLTLTLKPALAFDIESGRTSLQGQGGVDAVQYVRNSQADALVPHGQAALRWISPQPQAGVEMYASASQTSAVFGAPSSSTANTQGTYTNANAGVAPFLNAQLDSAWSLKGRWDASLMHVFRQDDQLPGRPGSRSQNARLALERAPAPLGVGLRVTHQTTESSGMSTPILEETSARMAVSHRDGPELNWGLGVARTHNASNGTRIDEHPVSVFVSWQPTPRTVVNAETEQRYFGRGWSLMAQHRMPWMVFNLSSDKRPTTFASSLGGQGQNMSLRDLYSAMLTTRLPDPAERNKAVNDLLNNRQVSVQVAPSGAFYSLQARLEDATVGRLAFLGRRDTLSVVGSLSRTRPLPQGGSILGDPGTRTKTYVLDTQVSHLLTPTSSMSAAVRWTQASASSTTSASQSRTFDWRMVYNTRLALNTSASIGMRRSISHAPKPVNMDETAGFMGLTHLF